MKPTNKERFNVLHMNFIPIYMMNQQPSPSPSMFVKRGNLWQGTATTFHAHSGFSKPLFCDKILRLPSYGSQYFTCDPHNPYLFRETTTCTSCKGWTSSNPKRPTYYASETRSLHWDSKLTLYAKVSSTGDSDIADDGNSSNQLSDDEEFLAELEIFRNARRARTQEFDLDKENDFDFNFQDRNSRNSKDVNEYIKNESYEGTVDSRLNIKKGTYSNTVSAPQGNHNTASGSEDPSTSNNIEQSYASTTPSSDRSKGNHELFQPFTFRGLVMRIFQGFTYFVREVLLPFLQIWSLFWYDFRLRLDSRSKGYFYDEETLKMEFKLNQPELFASASNKNHGRGFWKDGFNKQINIDPDSVADNVAGAFETVMENTTKAAFQAGSMMNSGWKALNDFLDGNDQDKTK